MRLYHFSWAFLLPRAIREESLPKVIGFAPTGNPSIGFESAVDLVKAIDAEWAKMDLDAMRKFYAENDGDQFQGFEAFDQRSFKRQMEHDVGLLRG